MINEKGEREKRGFSFPYLKTNLGNVKNKCIIGEHSITLHH
jgi:hypothetical protein